MIKIPFTKEHIKYFRASEIAGSIEPSGCRLYGHFIHYPPKGPRLHTFIGTRGSKIHDTIASTLYSGYNAIPTNNNTNFKDHTPKMEDTLNTKIKVDKIIALHNMEKFIEDHQITPLKVEERYWTEEPYPITGKIDVLGSTPNLALPVLIDWKYSKRKLKSHYHQMLIYYHLLTENKINVSMDLWVVLLRGNSYKLIEYYYNNDDLNELLDEFMSIKNDPTPVIPSDLKIRCAFCGFLPCCPMYHICY